MLLSLEALQSLKMLDSVDISVVDYGAEERPRVDNYILTGHLFSLQKRIAPQHLQMREPKGRVCGFRVLRDIDAYSSITVI